MQFVGVDRLMQQGQATGLNFTQMFNRRIGYLVKLFLQVILRRPPGAACKILRGQSPLNAHKRTAFQGAVTPYWSGVEECFASPAPVNPRIAL